MPTRAAFDENMRKIEVFALFERRSPALYRSAMDLAWQKMQRGASDAEVIVTVRESLMPNLVKLLPLATDPTLLAYHDVMIDELQALQARDTAACAELAFASGHAMKAVGAIPQELGQREQVRIFAGPAVRQASTPMAVCASARAFFESVRALPQVERVRALRVIYGSA